MKALKRAASLTTPDLVLLSLLAERPMHGYEANAELQRRHVRDWAAVSRPQIYYSLEKLLRLGLLRKIKGRKPAAGPERLVLATTSAGRTALADSLEIARWTTHRQRPPFLTWLAMSWQVRPGVFEQQVLRRHEFLTDLLAHERATLNDVLLEVGHRHHEAVWMLGLTMAQIEVELLWLRRILRDLKHRAPARAASRSSRLTSRRKPKSRKRL